MGLISFKIRCKYIMRYYSGVLLTLLFLSFSVLGIAARNHIVKGVVIDCDGEPEVYATIRIFAETDSVKPSVMGVTDVRGAFTCSVESAGTYRLTVVSVGKHPAVRKFEVSNQNTVVPLDTIVTEVNENLLEEVVVEAAKPLVAVEIDRISYDVANDMESSTAMVSGILRKVPLVSVDADGTIKVNGSTSFKVYKNGRPNNTFSNNSKEIFKALPASMIQKIEVITDPGAREDAEGTMAILNIVTVKNVVAKGLTGNVELTFNTRTTNIPTPHLWLSGQYGRLSMSVYGGGSLSADGSNKSRSESETNYLQTGNRLVSENYSTGKSQLGFWGFESSLDIDRHNLVTVEFGGFLSSGETKSAASTNMYDATGNRIYSYNSVGCNSPLRTSDFNGSINYQHSTGRDGETLILSYRVAGNKNKSISKTDYVDAENLPMEYTGIDADSRERGMEHTMQIDWSRPINDYQHLDMGGKYIYRENRSTVTRDYVEFRTDFSDFRHLTQIAALFADYRLKFGKFGARGGIRYEYSRLSAKFPDGSNDPFATDLSDLVPNVSLMFAANQRNSFKISFGSRIQRPGIYYLNPVVNTLPNSTSEGNPELKSVRRNSLSLNYSLMAAKVSVSIDANYSFVNNEIISVERTVGDHVYSGYDNIGRRRNLNIASYLSWRPWSKTTFVLSTSAYHASIRNPSVGESVSGWGYSVFGSVSQMLPWKVKFMAAAGWKEKAPELYSRRIPYGLSNVMFGLRLGRSFLKEDRLNVGIEIVNPVHTRHPGYITESWNAGMTSRTRSYDYRMTMVGVAVNYRFGSFKASVRKVNKGISNDDVVSGSSEFSCDQE